MKTKLLLLLLLANFSINAQTNLVSNGDFETWTAFSQPTDWFRLSSGLLYQDSNAQKGTSSTKMEITSGTIHNMNSSPFAIESGKTYRVTMYHKLVSGTITSVELSLTKNDTFKTTITKKTETTSTSSAWQKIEFDYVATTTQNAEISIWIKGTTGTQILVDNVSIFDVADTGVKYTRIPDLNFENALIELGIDSGTPDGQVLTSKVATVTSLPISSKDITDLTGIQDFKALKSLFCYYNKLASIDLSNNTELTSLYLDGNNLTTIDVSKNTKLTAFTCDSNKIASVDVSFNTLLTELSLNYNPLTSIDVSNLKVLRRLAFDNALVTSLDLSNNKDLTSLLANRNKIKTLNISANKELINLSCNANLLTALDVSIHPKLEYLDFSNNAITSIDLKFNTNLKALLCHSTQLTRLDLGNNKFLIGLYCQNNQNLTELNLKNGNNTNFLKNFTFLTGNRGGPQTSSFQNNLNLSCIQVDDVAYATTNWSTLVFYPSIYTLDCSSLVYTSIPDTNFEIKLMALGIDQDGKNGKVLTSNIANVTTLNVTKSNITDLTGIQDFTALKTLNCSENALTTLNVTANVNLTSLTVNKNQLKSINISKNPALDYFSGNNNQFTSLDFSANTALSKIYVTDNVLTILNVNSNSKLATLWCQRNKLPSLDIAKNLALTEFICDRNELVALNVSKNTALATLSCSENKITSLDVSQNTLLKLFNCSINKLENLNLRNGNNIALDKTYLSFFSNLSLKCIQVDDVAYSNANWSSTIKDAGASYNIDCTPYTLIPDSNFEDKLIALQIDKDGKNGKVATSSISALTSLNVSGSNIQNLIGIQDFVSLTYLNCSNNSLTSLDLSKNVALDALQADKNQLTSLNISANKSLTYLEIRNNKLTSLDISALTKLQSLSVGYNALTALNVSINKALTTLSCNNNKLTTLNVAQNTALDTFYCYENQITSLDVSSNILLEYFMCNANKLTTINVSKNPKLVMFDCLDNQLTSLDISNNPKITELACENNQLTSLNLKNGNNTKMVLGFTNFKNNPKLTCIQVDEETYANANWSALKDATASYNVDCTSYTLIPDAAFEDKLIALEIDKDGKNGKVATASIANVTFLDVQSSNIKDLTGIQDFTSLKYLDANYNNISNIDVSNNKLLTKLALHENKLTSLNVTKNVNLYNLMFSKNQISTIDLSQNKDLVILTADRNLLTSLDISKNTKLESLYCGDNNLTALNVSNQPNLLQLICTSTSISQLDVSTNKKLEDLYFNNAQLTTLDLNNNTLLKRINVSSNQLKHLDLSHNPILELVLIRFNPITSLNLQNGNNENFIMPPTGGTNKTAALIDACNFLNNKNLSCIQVDNVEYSNANWLAIKDATASYNLDCTTYTLIPDSNFEDKLIALKIDKDGKNGKVATASIASVTSLDVSSSSIKDLTGIQDFTSLKVLNCSTNQLTALNPASNPLLTELNVSYNAVTVLDVSKNPALTALNVSNNTLTSLNVKNGFNVNMDWFSVNFTKNPSLSCIQVDNAKYSNDNWNGKLDKTSFFTENCGSYTLIPDSNFEDELIALKIDIDGKNGKVLTSTIASVKDLNVQLSDIKDLTGIQDFAALEYLNCQFNLLTSLNVSKNTKLIELYTHGNDLTTLDLSANTALTTLYANKNKITALDLSKNNKLVYLNVTENALKTLNLKNGNNINFTGALLNKNTGLTCISVDNPAFAASSGLFFKDAAAIYSATCTLGIEDSVFNKVVMYPNPTKGEVHINNIALEKATVYNALGQLVKTFIFNNGETNNTINLSGLPRGVYYVYLINGDAASAKKVIVE